MTSANGRKPKYTGEFEIWGTDACRNYDYCGGRITLFVANKKCISCDPESYKKREVLPDDSAKDEWKDRFENADTIARAYASECGVLRGELDYHKNQLAKEQAEIEILKMQLEIAKDALDEIQHITIGGLKMDAADGMEPLDWKYHARNALAAIAKDVK